MSYKRGFLRPSNDSTFTNDRPETDLASAGSFVYNANHKLPISRQRQLLPVFAVHKHLLYLLENFLTVVVVGETGSGKSTQIPQYLLENGWCEDGMVAVTQTRRVACTSLASRVAEEQDCLLGQEVGYTIRFDDCSNPERTKIKFLTEAILVQEMMADPLVVMLDEVHERTQYTDILLALLKKILKRRKNYLRLIVCSATIDAEQMQYFFNFNKTHDKGKDTAAVLPITTRTYPIEVFYLQEPCADYVSEAASTAVKIHRTQPPGDVLVFLPGVDEIQRCFDLTQSHLQSSTHKGQLQEAMVVMMHGLLPPVELLRALKQPTPGVRKIVIATNIAETSLTIRGVTYVVDCGLVKLRMLQQRGAPSSDRLVLVKTSKASAMQRAGRAGRTAPGKVYRLYPEAEFDTLFESTPPEIMRCKLSAAVVKLLALGVDNLLRFELPSPPPAKHLAAALEELSALKAITNACELTVPLGQHMAQLPFDPPLSSMLLIAEDFGVSDEIAAIVALLQVQNVFITPKTNSQQARIMHAKFQATEGDLLSLLNAYTGWQRHQRSKQWSVKHYLSHLALSRAAEIHQRIVAQLKRWDAFRVAEETDKSLNIRRCIAAGLFTQAAYLHHSGEYRSVNGDVALSIHPSSVLYSENQPKWLVYNEILHTTKAFMRDITVIEESWLTELAPHYYQRSKLVQNAFL